MRFEDQYSEINWSKYSPILDYLHCFLKVKSDLLSPAYHQYGAMSQFSEESFNHHRDIFNQYLPHRFMFMPGNKFSFSRSLPPPSSSPLSPSLCLSCQATPRPPTPPSRTAANEQKTVQAHILTTEALISLNKKQKMFLFSKICCLLKKALWPLQTKI